MQKLSYSLSQHDHKQGMLHALRLSKKTSLHHATSIVVILRTTHSQTYLNGYLEGLSQAKALANSKK